MNLLQETSKLFSKIGCIILYVIYSVDKSVTIDDLMVNIHRHKIFFLTKIVTIATIWMGFILQ